MPNKRQRQAVIREIVQSRVVGSQEELRVLLEKRGWDVTQSTLSRDLREMRLARVSAPEGPRYQLTDGIGSSAHARAVLEGILPQLFVNIDGVGNLAVLHTFSGSASTVAEAIDVEEFPDVLGSIAGDNTVLIVCRSSAAREKLTEQIKELAGLG